MEGDDGTRLGDPPLRLVLLLLCYSLTPASARSIGHMSGGVKSNIGHTECAAVMAGMVRFGREG